MTTPSSSHRGRDIDEDQFVRPLRRRRWDRVGMIAGAGSMVSLLLVSAVSISHDGLVGHEVVTERFQGRAALTASFVTGHVEDLATRQRAQAARLLSEPEVSREAFEQVVLAFGFDAAVLLDSQGRAIGVWPPTPELIGDQLADQYAHLAAALDGRTGVSGVTLSAARSEPVIAIAVPFDTSSGRRVFSGAYALDTVSLGTSFDTVIPLAGRAYLIDDTGEIIVSGESHALSASPRALTRGELLSIDEPTGSFARGGEWLTFVREPVAGTPWHVVLITPSASLYQAVDGSSQVSWSLFAAFAVSGLIGLVLLSRLSRARSIAAATARLDALTQLPNRRAAEEHVHQTASTAAHRSRTYGVLMIDIDRFKNINDTYGHQTGDDVLAQVARTLRRVARGEDCVSRWGGEEFLVVVSMGTEYSIAVLAERFRSAVADMNIHVSATKSVNVTISVGGALSTDRTPTRALHAADSALYDAKLGGRNRVVMYRAGLDRPKRAPDVDSVDRVTVGL